MPEPLADLIERVEKIAGEPCPETEHDILTRWTGICDCASLVELRHIEVMRLLTVARAAIRYVEAVESPPLAGEELPDVYAALREAVR